MRHSHSAPTTIIAARTLLAVAIVAGTLAGAALSQQARVFSPPEASAVPPSADVSFVRLSSAAAGLNFSSPSSDRSVLSPHRPVIKTTTPNEGTCECIRVPFGADIISSAWPQAHAADPTPPAAYSDIPFAALSAERDRQGTFPTPAGFPYQAEIGVIAEAAAANGIQSVEDWYILLAIRCAENGRPGREFGVLAPRAVDTNLRTQAGWAAATVAANRRRFSDRVDTDLEFIVCLAGRYCPAVCDPVGHENWKKNVSYYYRQFTAEFK